MENKYWNFDKKNRETISLHDIPFSVKKENGVIQKEKIPSEIPVDQKCAALCFLGMTTDAPEGSEWWGINERHYYYGARVFIGDYLGQIRIVYGSDSMDIIPMIFGVNVWNYELLTEVKAEEKDLKTYGGPYTEPFQSDPNAKKLLDNSLVLLENKEQKFAKYIFFIKPQDKIVKKIVFHKFDYKEAGFCVSAVTGVLEQNLIKEGYRCYDYLYYLKKMYYPDMDKLARRLYQYKDEIPNSDKEVDTGNSAMPKITFKGSNSAEIFTNVYRVNLNEILTHKIDDNGLAHTSSPNAPSFGSYVGMGTYKKAANAYTTHMWARDIGRILFEAAKSGENIKLRKAGDMVHKYLYDGRAKYDVPQWKRIINLSELPDIKGWFGTGKENDGHAAIMVFVYSLLNQSVADINWFNENRKHIHAAVDFIGWQIHNPSSSNFCGVLYSESEASRQQYGGIDLFSNAYAYYALLAYKKIGKAIKDAILEKKCTEYAETLKKGIYSIFITDHPRYGKIFIDTTDDCWTWEYKRFVLLFNYADIFGYEVEDQELLQICRNTMKAQKEDYDSPSAGRQMGYGQGYLTEAHLMLDEFDDFTACIRQAAYFSYHHSDYNYIVPEGVIIHPSGRYWFRNADLGNAVQQGEIVKSGKLVVGIDDNHEDGLCLVPRIPNDWISINTENYNACVCGKRYHIFMHYARKDSGYELSFKSSEIIPVKYIRIGPFPSVENSKNEEYSCNVPFDKETKKINQYEFVYLYVNDNIDSLSVSVIRRIKKNEL
jgi:hypothetical protein